MVRLDSVLDKDGGSVGGAGRELDRKGHCDAELEMKGFGLSLTF